MIDRHHLLECILLPNGDGTFRKIINRSQRLKDLGVYEDYKLTIQIDHAVHSSMHREFEKGYEYEVMDGKSSMYRRTGNDNYMYGRTGDKCPNWKGDKAGPAKLYRRQLEMYKAGEITESELQPYRDAYNDHRKQRQMRKLKCQQLT